MTTDTPRVCDRNKVSKRSARCTRAILRAGLLPCIRSPRVTCAATRRLRWILAVLVATAPSAAWALVTGEVADQVADVLAVIVLIFAPLAGIYLFWKLHILPEQIAEKRHHPQKDAIRAMCLLSLIFGGVLWPVALIWAYTKPSLHTLASGMGKLEGEEAVAERREPRLAVLRSEIDRLSDEGAPPEDLEVLKRDLARIRDKLFTPRPEVH